MRRAEAAAVGHRRCGGGAQQILSQRALPPRRGVGLAQGVEDGRGGARARADARVRVRTREPTLADARTLVPMRALARAHARTCLPTQVAAANSERLRLSSGRKVMEIKPRIDWDKGRAVAYLLEALGLASDPGCLPIYLGDDTTDEDAFRCLREREVRQPSCRGSLAPRHFPLYLSCEAPPPSHAMRARVRARRADTVCRPASLGARVDAGRRCGRHCRVDHQAHRGRLSLARPGRGSGIPREGGGDAGEVGRGGAGGRRGRGRGRGDVAFRRGLGPARAPRRVMQSAVAAGTPNALRWRCGAPRTCAARGCACVHVCLCIVLSRACVFVVHARECETPLPTRAPTRHPIPQGHPSPTHRRRARGGARGSARGFCGQPRSVSKCSLKPSSPGPMSQ